jgi:hypothetical protein
VHDVYRVDSLHAGRFDVVGAESDLFCPHCLSRKQDELDVDTLYGMLYGLLCIVKTRGLLAVLVAAWRACGIHVAGYRRGIILFVAVLLPPAPNTPHLRGLLGAQRVADNADVWTDIAHQHIISVPFSSPV